MDLAYYADVAYPLHKAAREGRGEQLLALLETGQYEVNNGSFDLVRPLHEACLQGHYQCACILLDHGAQVNIRNIDGATPLCDASSKGSVEIVKLLLDNGAQVNPQLAYSTPLHEAVMYNRWQCVELLLAHQANPNRSDCHYGYPLHIAASRGHHRCAEILLSYGANVNGTHIHNTALHVSCKRQDKAMVTLLLGHGADVYAEDNQGRTARDLIPSQGALKKFLYLWERTPKSLSHHCRLSVRCALGNRGLHLLQQVDLQVPQVVKDFLQFQPQKKFVIDNTANIAKPELCRAKDELVVFC
ncbi:ankyrin repeat and SOCS box protein 13-like [Littorina saxatilis]|uniref:SOCS box domain-containing protein n=1 Tax=Littorina saxatilis TaxID=31220 RepID=A0AAN9B9N8_9CAEN